MFPLVSTTIRESAALMARCNDVSMVAYRSLAPRNALPRAIEFYRLPAQRWIDGPSLDESDERGGARRRAHLAAGGGAFVDVRDDHRGGLHQRVDRIGGRLWRERALSKIELHQVRLVEIMLDRLHLGVYPCVAGQIGGEPVGEPDDVAAGRPEREAHIVGFQILALRVVEQGDQKGAVVRWWHVRYLGGLGRGRRLERARAARLNGGEAGRGQRRHEVGAGLRRACRRSVAPDRLALSCA